MPPRSGIETTPFGISFYGGESSESNGWTIHITPPGNLKISFEKCNSFQFPYGDGANITDKDFDEVFS